MLARLYPPWSGLRIMSLHGVDFAIKSKRRNQEFRCTPQAAFLFLTLLRTGFLDGEAIDGVIGGKRVRIMIPIEI